MNGCSFTGHRAIPNEVRARLNGLLTRAIAYAYDNGCRSFYCGGALGFDTMAAKAIILFRMSHPDARLIILVPCKDQSLAWQWAAKDMYDYLLSAADEVVYVTDGAYTSDCMRRRNAMLAEVCDILIAYSGNPRSGSGQTVRMAQKLGKTVYNLYSAAAEQ